MSPSLPLRAAIAAVLLTACGASGGPEANLGGEPAGADANAAGDASGDDASPKSAGGATAPDFSLPALDGEVVRLSDYIGESVVLINFWSTTCDPCMVEMPHLVKLYEQHKAKNFVVLAVSLDGPESRAAVSSVVHDKDMTFPVLLDEETTVVARYNPKRELPFSVIIDKSGAIVHKRGGYQPGDEKSLEEHVKKALASK